MSRPRTLACADLGDHVVDLWADDRGTWWCGNDDRSVVAGGETPDCALDQYLASLTEARFSFA